jgi:hypothetical protein
LGNPSCPPDTKTRHKELQINLDKQLSLQVQLFPAKKPFIEADGFPWKHYL